MFSLLLMDALEGELDDCWVDLRGDFLLLPILGGLNTIFRLLEAFLIGRRGDEDSNFDGFGIEAVV